MHRYVKPALAALRIATTTANVSSLALLRNPRAFYGYLAEASFVFGAFNGRRGLPERNVFDVLPADGKQDITLANLIPDGTWFERSSPLSQDIVSLCLIARLLKPRNVFEIGTLNGYTAYHFALNSGPDTRVYTLDLPRTKTVRPRLETSPVDREYITRYRNVREFCFQDSPEAERIVTLEGDSARFDFSPYERSIDLFFVDGAHSYDYVRSDSRNALRCIRPGGVVAWHDFGRAGTNGVRRFLLELSKEREIYCTPGGSLAFTVV